MKIGSILQSLSQSKTLPTTEKNVGEALIEDYKSKSMALSKPVQNIFDKYQFTPSTENVKQVSAFMKNASGSEAQKLEAVEIALYKGIEPTEDNLMSVHSALAHDAEVVETLIESPKVADLKLSNQEVIKVFKALKLPEAVKEAILSKVENGLTLKDALRAVGEALGIVFDEDSKLSEIIIKLQNIKPIMSMAVAATEGPKPQNSLPIIDLDRFGSTLTISEVNQISTTESKDTIKGDILSTAAMSSFELSAVNESLFESDHALDLERTKGAMASPDFEDETEETKWLAMIDEAVAGLMSQSFDIYEAIADQIGLKTYLVTSTTEATIKAKQTFEVFQKETLSLLESKTNVAADLTKAVEKINQIILKSDVTLFTDMHTEKKLLVMSSELDKALVLIKNGEIGKAKEIVSASAKLLSDIRFNPSQKRVQVFAEEKMNQFGKMFKGEQQKTERLDLQIRQQLISHRGAGPARDVLETLRFLGLNHEMEVAEALEQNRQETFKAWNQSNVKEILLKLMKEDVENRTVSGVEQNLMNLSGQQMMNDSGTEEQPFYFFNLPILEDEELGNMKVYMKGSSRNHQIDWQNAELYFGVSFKNESSIGIKVRIQDGKLDIEMLEDSDSGLLSSLDDVMLQMEALGFSKGRVVSKPYNGAQAKPTLRPSVVEKPVYANTETKGFDFKV